MLQVAWIHFTNGNVLSKQLFFQIKFLFCPLNMGREEGLCYEMMILLEMKR